jgi:hypothetical protein
MAYYYSLRGWLECDSEEFISIVDALGKLTSACASDQQKALYLKGWCWGTHEVNWLRYIFYGAAVQEIGLKLLDTTLKEFISVAPGVEGRFEASGEDGETCWVVKVLDRQISWSDSKDQ